MTRDQVEEHNRSYEEAAQLVRAEIILHGHEPGSVDQPAHLKLERALQLFARVLELNPENWSAMWLVGKVHQRLGDYPTALTWFARSCETNPSQADAAREASLCAMFMGYSEDAISYAHKALQLQPSNTGLRQNLALAFLLAGKIEDAKAAIDRVPVVSQDTVSKTVRNMVNHFLAAGQRPPSRAAELQEYWRKIHRPA